MRVRRLLLKYGEGIERLGQPLLLVQGRGKVALCFEGTRARSYRLPKKLLGLDQSAGFERDRAKQSQAPGFIAIFPEVLDDEHGSGVQLPTVHLLLGFRQSGVGSNNRHKILLDHR